jgi:hypothetical protein
MKRTTRGLLLAVLLLSAAVVAPNKAKAQSATPTYCWGGFSASTGSGGWDLIILLFAAFPELLGA